MTNRPPRRRLAPRGVRTINVVCSTCRWRLAEVWPDDWTGWNGVVHAERLLPHPLPGGVVEYLPAPGTGPTSQVDPVRWRCRRHGCGTTEDVDDGALAQAVRGSRFEVTLVDDRAPPPLPPLGPGSRDW